MAEPTTVTTIMGGLMQVANVFAWIVIAYFFMTGKIFSASAVDRLQDLMKEATTKLANEVAEKIPDSVEQGVLKAYMKLGEKKE